jgi:hypothetical protein
MGGGFFHHTKMGEGRQFRKSRLIVALQDQL